MLITNFQKLTYSSILVILTFLLTNLHAAEEISLVDVILQNTPKLTRLNLKFTAKPKYKLFTLDNPHRIVFDIFNTKNKYGFKKLPITSSYLTKIRVHEYKNKLRLVFDTVKNTGCRAKLGKNSNHLHLTFHTAQNHIEKDNKKIPNNTPILRNLRILIDPGHGGTEPGAVGQYGTCEKDITLRVAIQLKRIIDKEPGLTAMLTRNSDHFLHIRTRLRNARKKESDLFLSIHADSFNNASCKGASVYILSKHGATTEAARWIAARENYSVLGGDIDLKTKDSVLRTVLYDLSQTATSGSSMKMASNILKELRKVTSLHSKRVESAPFAVLKSPDIPSVLVELGFLSNGQEEKELNKVEHRKKLAKAIFIGIKKYINSNPIKSTYYARSVEYIVKKGDNLGKLSMLYSTTVTDIKKMNKLSNAIIVPGMKLQIPNIL